MNRKNHGTETPDPACPQTATTPATKPAAETPAAPLTPEQIAELQAKAAQARENWERLLRVSADLENYRKRATRDRQEAVKFANEALLQKLVPVLDNFDMALAAVNSQQEATVQPLQTGIAMIFQQLKTVLAEAGLEAIDALGQPFDPNYHEAVGQQESAEVPEGQVLQQLRKGYKLKDRLLRPASVVVAKKPEPK